MGERRSTHQAPKPKLQKSSKSQNTNFQNGSRGQTAFLSLLLGSSLELGVWNLELFAWALNFSKIGVRPPSRLLGETAWQVNASRVSTVLSLLMRPGLFLFATLIGLNS